MKPKINTDENQLSKSLAPPFLTLYPYCDFFPLIGGNLGPSAARGHAKSVAPQAARFNTSTTQQRYNTSRDRKGAVPPAAANLP
jgi:hypothetical protein